MSSRTVVPRFRQVGVDNKEITAAGEGAGISALQPDKTCALIVCSLNNSRCCQGGLRRRVRQKSTERESEVQTLLVVLGEHLSRLADPAALLLARRGTDRFLWLRSSSRRVVRREESPGGWSGFGERSEALACRPCIVFIFPFEQVLFSVNPSEGDIAIPNAYVHHQKFIFQIEEHIGKVRFVTNTLK